MSDIKLALFAALVLALASVGCSDLLKGRSEQAKQQDAPCPVQRYVPVGNNPEIALDTQNGMLCRTIPDTNDPLGILDPACAVNEQEKKLGFIPDACKGRQTWVRGERHKHASRYTSLPVCQK